jgi:hypothetical protein
MAGVLGRHAAAQRMGNDRMTHHHASGNCDATLGPENGAAPPMARPSTRVLAVVPDIPQNLSHRAWFSREQYKELHTVARQRANDREILRSAHQDPTRCSCNQRHVAQEKQERRENRPEHSGFTATSKCGNECVKSGNVPYHEIRQPRAGVAEWHTQRT